MLKALERFEDVISTTPRTLDFLMREGELLFSDNRRTIHARTPIAAGAASDRLMIRSWIRTTD
jgi:alpha-ketoglutarate-dependent taurine dioxygenase